MGVPHDQLPAWDDIQFVQPSSRDAHFSTTKPVDTTTVIGPRASKPLTLAIPLFVSDMSFGALSEEAKISLALGADGAGTGICSGEGGMLPEEKAANGRYFYELASGRFGCLSIASLTSRPFILSLVKEQRPNRRSLTGSEVQGKIAEVRNLDPGTDAVSPATFPDLITADDYRELAAEVREVSGGVPIGAKLSAQHIEADIDAALSIGVDYIIVDGRGGGTGAAPRIFRDNISVPTIPALARARRHLDSSGASDGHAHRHWWVADSSRLREGIGSRCRCNCSREQCDASDWLPRHAGLQHKQLSSRHRNSTGRSSVTTCHQRSCRSLDSLLCVFG